MPTTVQIRGATEATQESRTLGARELDVNTSDDRIAVHDGSTAGGIPHANCFDTQNNEWTYASAAGTADVLTLALARAPAAYAAGQKFIFKATATNTGSATLNVDSLGAKTFNKLEDGVLVTLAAGDITSGVTYECWYDGTVMVIDTLGASGGLSPNTQTASVSASLDFDTVFTAGNNYVIRIANILNASTNNRLFIRFTDDNGSTFETSNYVHYGRFIDASTPADFTGATNAAFATEGGGGTANDVLNSGSGVSGYMYLGNPAAAVETHYTYNFSFEGQVGGTKFNTGGGQHNSATALTGFQVRAEGGNLTSGTVTVEEYAHS